MGGSYKNAVNNSAPNSAKNYSSGMTTNPEINNTMKGKNEGPALQPSGSASTIIKQTSPHGKPTHGMPAEGKLIPVPAAESRAALTSSFNHGAPPGLAPVAVHSNLHSHAFPYYHQPSNPTVYNTSLPNSSFGLDLEFSGIDGGIYSSPQRNALSDPNDRFLAVPNSGLWANSNPANSFGNLMQSMNINRPARVSDFFHDNDDSDDLGLVNPGNLLDLDFLGQDPSAPQRSNDNSITPNFIPNITLEASSMLSGLSPNAPSFRPSQQHSALPQTSADVHMDFDSGREDHFHFDGDNAAYASEEFIKSFYDIIDG